MRTFRSARTLAPLGLDLILPVRSREAYVNFSHCKGRGLFSEPTPPFGMPSANIKTGRTTPDLGTRPTETTMYATPTFVLLIALLLVSSTGQAQLSKQCCREAGGTISVTGAGRRSFPTSIAVIRLGIEFSAKTAGEVQQKVANLSKDLTDYLMLQNVDKLMTTGISLQAQRKYDVTPPVIKGYSGSNTVSFEVPFTSAGAILDGAVRNGASQISGISFKATPLVSGKARNQALRDATVAAHREARVVARTLGVPLGKPKTVTITDAFSPPAQESMSRESAPAFKAAAAPPPTSVIVGGESTATARVQIIFNLAW